MRAPSISWIINQKHHLGFFLKRLPTRTPQWWASVGRSSSFYPEGASQQPITKSLQTACTLFIFGEGIKADTWRDYLDLEYTLQKPLFVHV